MLPIIAAAAVSLAVGGIAGYFVTTRKPSATLPTPVPPVPRAPFATFAQLRVGDTAVFQLDGRPEQAVVKTKVNKKLLKAAEHCTLVLREGIELQDEAGRVRVTRAGHSLVGRLEVTPLAGGAPQKLLIAVDRLALSAPEAFSGVALMFAHVNGFHADPRDLAALTTLSRLMPEPDGAMVAEATAEAKTAAKAAEKAATAPVDEAVAVDPFTVVVNEEHLQPQ